MIVISLVRTVIKHRNVKNTYCMLGEGLTPLGTAQAVELLVTPINTSVITLPVKKML